MAITSMALMVQLPDNVLFRVLSERIQNTNLMPWLNDINSKNADDQAKWILADEDLRLWKVSVDKIKFHDLSF